MWDKLSMAEKAHIIALGVQSGITDLNIIRQRYNSFANEDIKNYNKFGDGGPYSAGKMTDALYEAAKKVERLGDPDHHYDFNQTDEWADAHGYYLDNRGHRDDRVKKLAHPTHPSRGKWNGLNEFQLTELGMKDPNYTMFGMADGDQDPQATLTYKGTIVLPEITVTPKANYIHNSYDNLNIKYGIGGTLRKRIRSALGKNTNRQDTRINTRQFQSSNVEQVDRTNVRRVNPSQVQNKIQDNQNKAVAYQILKRRYPQAAADGMDYEGLVNLDKSTTPVSFNGKVYVGGNYQPQETSYSQDNKSNQEHKQAQSAFIQNQEQQRKEDEIKQTVELLNNPYNPIGWIPGLRSVVNAGADQNYSRTHNTAFTPYTADATFSTAGDAVTLGFGLGPFKNYARSYAGTVAGGLIGEQFDNPQLGQIIGGITGGFSPQIYNTSKEFLSNKFDPYLLARTMDSSLKSAQIPLELHPIRTDFNFGKGSGRVLRADKGDARGIFTGHGAYIQNGFLYPGKARMEGQRDFTWWNEDELFSTRSNKEPHQRVFIANKSDIPGLQRVREMNEAVGQWRPGRKSFVRKSEMVTSEPIDISNLTQYNYDPNLGIYVRSDIQTHNLSLSQLNPQNTPFTEYDLPLLTLIRKQQSSTSNKK